MIEPIYLDYNASTPIAPEVAAAMAPFATRHYGNPHTTHWAGRPAAEAIARARAQVAQAIGCEADEVYFTGGASEANNWAIKGVYFANRDRGDHLITSTVEHASVRGALRYLEERFAAKVTYVPVDRFGRIDPRDVERAITPRSVLITVLHAQNEVGTIEPIDEIGAIARRYDVPLHCDAAQSLGKIPVDVDDLRVDLLSIAGHKLYAPKGVGALYIRQRGRATPLRIDPLIHGAGQEGGLRGGTENVEFIVGLGAACELYRTSNAAARMSELCEYLWRRLREAFGERVALHGHPEQRLPNTLNVGFRGVTGSELLEKLEGVAASPGAACHYGEAKLSATLAAMGVDPTFGLGAVRWSIGRNTTREEIDRVVSRLVGALSAMPGGGPAAGA